MTVVERQVSDVIQGSSVGPAYFGRQQTQEWVAQISVATVAGRDAARRRLAVLVDSVVAL